MSRLTKLLRYFLTVVFAFSFIAPIATTVIINVFELIANESNVSQAAMIVFILFSSFIAFFFTPFWIVKFLAFAACGETSIAITENLPLGDATVTTSVVILIVTTVFLVLPLIGMCFVKKAPKLYRLLVYTPLVLYLILSAYLVFEWSFWGEFFSVLIFAKDCIYLLLAILLDLLYIRER